MEHRQWLKASKNNIKKYTNNVHDIIRTDYVEDEVIMNGMRTIKRMPITTNITKQVNETAKLLKIETINQKAEQLKKLLQGENN